MRGLPYVPRPSQCEAMINVPRGESSRAGGDGGRLVAQVIISARPFLRALDDLARSPVGLSDAEAPPCASGRRARLFRGGGRAPPR
jgi:hypothetical protein